MRWVCHIDGKKEIFETHEAYLKAIDGKKAVVPAMRERCRKASSVGHGREWREAQVPVSERLQIRNDPPPGTDALKFSLIHPTRGRPERGLSTIIRWANRCTPNSGLEYILVIDSNEPDYYQAILRECACKIDLKIVRWDNPSMVSALNRGAALSTGDVLIYVADDIDCPSGWDQEIAKRVKGIADPWVMFVADGSKVTDRFQTTCILSRTYYAQLGYVYHPDYISMYVDNDFTEQALKRARVIDARKELTFKHSHYSHGNGVAMDDTYVWQNRPEAWTKGEWVLARRRGEGFPEVPALNLFPRYSGSRPLLSILVPTLKSRKERYLAPLMEKLRLQSFGIESYVEVVTLEDEGQLTIGAKRNQALERATGIFSVFIDDDDYIPDCYVSGIVDVLHRFPDADCVGICESVFFEDVYAGRGFHTTLCPHWTEGGGFYYRPIDQRTPVRTDLARMIRYRDLRWSEDHFWSLDMEKSGMLRREVLLARIPFYHYLCREKKRGL